MIDRWCTTDLDRATPCRVDSEQVLLLTLGAWFVTIVASTILWKQVIRIGALSTT